MVLLSRVSFFSDTFSLFYFLVCSIPGSRHLLVDRTSSDIGTLRPSPVLDHILPLLFPLCHYGCLLQYLGIRVSCGILLFSVLHLALFPADMKSHSAICHMLKAPSPSTLHTRNLSRVTNENKSISSRMLMHPGLTASKHPKQNISAPWQLPKSPKCNGPK